MNKEEKKNVKKCNKKKEGMMKKIRILSLIIIFVFTLWSLIVFTPYRIGICRGESMAPIIRENDLIIMKLFNPKKSEIIKQGMIIAYEEEGERGERERIVHRVISISKEQIITKGDNNDISDPPISISQVREIHLLTISSPWIGKIILFLKNHLSFAFSLIIILFVILIFLNLGKSLNLGKRR